ncbi:MAG TPA: hypothetical protein VKL22_04270 [Actinomycetota bacterium]|nr:hypothetical protein [Actinomycetota bacterium]
MTTLLVVLTVAEILLFVVVLGAYLVRIATRLRSIASNLAKVTFGVRAIEQEAAAVAPAANRINSALGGVVRELTAAADRIAR